MSDITHCLTIGRRPDLLRRTLESLPPSLRALPTLAINDFGDAATNEVFAALVPDGRIVGPGHHLGHHGAVDAMYAEVTTPFIFHGEDDWGFTRDGFLDDARRLLEADPKIAVVCVRDLSDFTYHTDADRARIFHAEAGGVRYARLDALAPQWHGYTFNPHLARRSLWSDLGGFSRFEKERHISRHLRAEGMFAAFLTPGACAHLGDGRSVVPAPPKRFAGLRRAVKRVLR